MWHYSLGINGGVKGALTGTFDPMHGGLSLPILDFDQLSDIYLMCNNF